MGWGGGRGPKRDWLLTQPGPKIHVRTTTRTILDGLPGSEDVFSGILADHFCSGSFFRCYTEPCGIGHCSKLHIHVVHTVAMKARRSAEMTPAEVQSSQGDLA